jgi:putative ABC transport system permease protein
MPASWRKVITDIWANKTRTFLMILTITLGVFSVGFVGNIGSMMNRDMAADYASANPYDAVIYAGPFDEDWVKALRKVSGVSDVEGRTQVTAQLVQESGSKISIFFDVVKPYRSIRMDLLKPADAVSGTLPVHCDGETVCFEGKELEIEILPAQIEVITQKPEA